MNTPVPITKQVLVRALGRDRLVTDHPLSDTLAAGASLPTLVPRALEPPMWGFDTSERLNAEQYLFMKGLGATFAVRYVPLAGQSVGLGIDLNEVYACCVTAKLGLMLVQFSRTSGLSPQQGHDDGLAFAERAGALGLHKSCCAWGDFFPSDDTTMQTYGNAWYAGTGAGPTPIDPQLPGGYWEPGFNPSLNLFTAYNFHGYWRDAAQVPNVDRRGYKLHQVWPGNRKPRADIVVDYDFVSSDYYGVYPVAAFAG